MESILAFDCGGTRTRAGLYARDRKLVTEAEGGSSNPAEMGVDGCVALLVRMGRSLLPEGAILTRVAAGVAGASNREMRQCIANLLAAHLQPRRVVVSDDRWPLLKANLGREPGVIVIAGTGSSVTAQSENGEVLHLGGRGRIIGDEGSSVHIVLRALRACCHGEDGCGPATGLTPLLARAADCHDLDGMALWSLSASKDALAALAPTVIEAALQGDAVAKSCVDREAVILATQADVSMKRLALPETAPVLFHGGLIEGSDLYRKAFLDTLHQARPHVTCRPVTLRGHRAVQELAEGEASDQTACCEVKVHSKAARPATEEALGAAKNLDQLSALEIVRFMNEQNARVSAAVIHEAQAIADTMEDTARAFTRGGRLIYVGAGTSGRLGVLDASECPPTFGVPPDKVVGIIAGGDQALRFSREGAEDDAGRAAADLGNLDPPLSEKDVVVGISASGTTPYVTGAIEAARAQGAHTVLLCCNPACDNPSGAHRVIALSTGPEVLAGSTRLKAGTATKLVLNMLTTGAMALTGHIHKGLMVGIQPLCEKLRRRAKGIVQALTGVSEEQAKELLEKADHHIPVAVMMQQVGITKQEAQARLEQAGGSLGRALKTEEE